MIQINENHETENLIEDWLIENKYSFRVFQDVTTDR